LGTPRSDASIVGPSRSSDRGRGAGVQRRELLLDGDPHLGLSVLAELDAPDLPDGRAADPNQVALYERPAFRNRNV
jgi:hypothetical protein